MTTLTIALLWPVPASARAAAGVRLTSFQNAAKKLGVPSVTIVPAGREHNQSIAHSKDLRVQLYDSYVALGGPPLALCFLPISTLRLIRLLRLQQCRCVVASTPAPFAPFQGLIACRVLGIPFVLDVRDSWEMEAFTHKGTLRNMFKGFVERMCARSADLVMCVTHGLMNQLRVSHGVESQKLAVVPNGADLGLFQSRDTIRKTDLIFVGAPSKYRNVEGILAAIALLARIRPTVTATFLGWADDPTTPSICDLAAHLDIASKIRLHATVDHRDVPRYLAESRLGIVSISTEDAFRTAIGAKVYEYVACGLPLACLGPPGQSELRQFIRANDIGFFATTPEDFAVQANRLLENPAIWSHLSSNCVAIARNHDRRAIAERAVAELILPLAQRDHT